MSAFGDAFKAARAAGKKTFTFNGKSYHTRTKEDEAKPAAKPDVSKATAGPAVYEKKKAPPMDDATKARVKRNALEQKAMRGEDMSDYVKKLPDNRPPVEGATFSSKGAPERKSPEMKKLPDTRADRTKAPEMIKADNKDDTSLSVSERIKRAKDRARTSDTGTDTRSVSERIKSAFKSAGDAVSPTAGMARRAREAAEKEMGKGMKRGGTVRGDGIAKRGKTKGRMC